MIARAIAASVPFKWVAGDTVYGVGDIEQQLRRAGKELSPNFGDGRAGQAAAVLG
jgi:SRSO17 transposase